MMLRRRLGKGALSALSRCCLGGASSTSRGSFASEWSMSRL